MNFFNKNRMIIIIFSVILLILMIGFSVSDRTHTTKAEQFVGDTVSTSQRIIDAPFNLIGNVFGSIFDVFSSDKNKKELEAELEMMPQLKEDNKRLEEENKELKEALDVSSKMDYESVTSRIISRSPDQWLESFTVDKGVNDGIEEGMAVMTPKGLIGIVKRANQSSSYVEMITTDAAKNNISVEIHDDKTKHYGVIESYDEEKEALIVGNIINDGEIKEGSKVYTSGLTDDFPEGLILGEVVDSENDNYGLSQNVFIKMNSDLNDMDAVFILKRDPESEVEDE